MAVDGEEMTVVSRLNRLMRALELSLAAPLHSPRSQSSESSKECWLRLPRQPVAAESF